MVELCYRKSCLSVFKCLQVKHSTEDLVEKANATCQPDR